ncbi:MAG: hypothetical protein ACI4PR_04600 [Acutalibacteraceae bacterium]
MVRYISLLISILNVVLANCNYTHRIEIKADDPKVLNSTVIRLKDNIENDLRTAMVLKSGESLKNFFDRDKVIMVLNSLDIDREEFNDFLN